MCVRATVALCEQTQRQQARHRRWPAGGVIQHPSQREAGHNQSRRDFGVSVVNIMASGCEELTATATATATTTTAATKLAKTKTNTSLCIDFVI